MFIYPSYISYFVESRKIIQLAKNTLVVSLPAKWAQKNHLKKGDDMSIEAYENKLILSPAKETTFGNKFQACKGKILCTYQSSFQPIMKKQT